jgi:pimeloyl-ACP methyl ester carboxylesterase
LLGQQHDWREDLQNWRVFSEKMRVLWVAGERDRKFVTLLHELQDLGVPGEFWMCPNAGHAVFLDSPADLAEKIRFFLV